MRLSSSALTLSSTLLICAAANAQMTTQQYVDALRQSIDFESQAQYQASIQVLESALVKAVGAGRQDWEATLLGFLGSLYQHTGKYSEAEAAFNKSVADWTRLSGPNAKQLVGPLAGLGGLYYEASQYSHAQRLLEHALEVESGNDNDTALLAMLHINLASVYFAQRKDGDASEQAEVALEKFALIANGREGTARCYSILGAVDLRAGSMDEARSYFEKALVLWQAVYGENDPHTAEGEGNLAIYYFAAGNSREAEPLFRKATDTFQVTGGSNQFITELYNQYAAVEKALGHKKEAKLIEKKQEQMAIVSARNAISRDVVDVSGFRAPDNSIRADVR